MPFPSPTNSATLIGKLTRDPELRTVSTSAGDRSVLTLGLAVRKPVKTDDDDTPTADFFDVTVWGAEAESCAKYLRKGRLAAVSARLNRPPGMHQTAPSAAAWSHCHRHRVLGPPPAGRGLSGAPAAGGPRRCIARPGRSPPYRGGHAALRLMRAYQFASAAGHAKHGCAFASKASPRAVLLNAYGVASACRPGSPQTLLTT